MIYIDDERKTVAEALTRGATVGFLCSWLSTKRSRGTPPYRPSNKEIREMIEPEVTAYRNKVIAEFNSLKDTQRWFGNRRQQALHQYFTVRPLYYMAGFNDPAKEILGKIKNYTFLGHTFPVHQDFMPGLERVQQKLREAGLYERMRPLFTENDGGFCPRVVAGSKNSSLSGHAFGMAIDIDSPENPRIWFKDRTKIFPLLNEAIKRQSGFDYDFGSEVLVEQSQNWRVMSDRQKISAVGQAWSITFRYGAAKKASEALQEWLKESRARYDICLQQIHQGKGAKDGTAAFDIAQSAKNDLDNDRDLQIMEELIKRVGKEELDSWAEKGILNLPIELVAAFYMAFSGDPDFLWGGADYHDSKDFMHFERQPLPGGVPFRRGCLTKTRSFKPEKNAAIVRTLEDLFPGMIPFLRWVDSDTHDWLVPREIVA